MPIPRLPMDPAHNTAHFALARFAIDRPGAPAADLPHAAIRPWD